MTPHGDEPFNPPQTSLVDAHGRPAKAETPRCPRCQQPSPKGDITKRTRSGGFGDDVHDVCLNCGYEFHGELTV